MREAPMVKKKIIIGSDHAGYEVKEYIKSLLEQENIEVDDAGTYTAESVDYPDFAEKVARGVEDGSHDLGIVTCGSGIGASIAANKVRGIRAALVKDEETARLCRQHNDANVLALAGRPFDRQEVKKMVEAFLSTPFEGGRHQGRIDKIAAIEEKYLTGRMDSRPQAY
jgi:ribose 5-phosphate isomerase B